MGWGESIQLHQTQTCLAQRNNKKQTAPSPLEKGASSLLADKNID